MIAVSSVSALGFSLFLIFVGEVDSPYISKQVGPNLATASVLFFLIRVKRQIDLVSGKLIAHSTL